MNSPLYEYGVELDLCSGTSSVLIICIIHASVYCLIKFDCVESSVCVYGCCVLSED